MSHNVFLVEDHPVVREVYSNILAQTDGICMCGIAATAEDALAALGDLACDLVVTDVRLPGMSGIDLVERLMASRPELLVLVVSGHEEAVFEDRALKAGAAAFLPKRLAATKLIPTVASLLAGLGV